MILKQAFELTPGNIEIVLNLSGRQELLDIVSINSRASSTTAGPLSR
jgi:hypothetical protein